MIIPEGIAGGVLEEDEDNVWFTNISQALKDPPPPQLRYI